MQLGIADLVIDAGCRAAGKTHHTLLHFTDTRGSANQGALSQHHEVVNQNLVPDQGTTSTCSTLASVGPCEVLLQVTPVKVMSRACCQITTNGLIDSGSDIKDKGIAQQTFTDDSAQY